jgi:hypothetical protein
MLLLATPAGLKNLSNYKVLCGQTESTLPIASKRLSGALATPGSTDPPPLSEKAARDRPTRRGVSLLEERETSNLQARAALKTEAAPSEPGAAHG